MIKRKILLVDDELAVLKVTKLRLEHSGYEVVTATDGEKALEEALTLAETLDLILLDLKLPKLDGFQVYERLKKNPGASKIPMIVFTASSEKCQDLTDRCVELGIADKIRKPFQSGELLEKIRRVLKEEEVSND